MQIVEQKVYQLMDTEGFNKWRERHPDPSDSDMEVALTRFFKPREDMSAEDFLAGRDPLIPEG